MSGFVILFHLLILCACVYAIQFYLAKLYNFVKNYLQERYGVQNNNNNNNVDTAAGSANFSTPHQIEIRTMSNSPHPYPKYHRSPFLTPNPPPYSINVLPYPQQSSSMLTPTTGISPYPPHQLGFYGASSTHSIYQTPTNVLPVQQHNIHVDQENNVEKSQNLAAEKS